MSDTLLKLSDINISFSGVQILKNVNMQIQKGEIHCLIGENGCGKSTIVKIVSGVYKPDSGTIEINGKSHSVMNPTAAMEEGIQIIWQDFSVFPNLTVFENIALNQDLYNKNFFVNQKERRKLARHALDLIGVDIDLDATVGSLSVAKKQLVAIARALLNNAKFIIMDEPTTALTKNEVASLFKVVKDLQKQGMTILFIGHKLDEVFEIAENFTIIRNGEVVKEGQTKDFNQEDFVYYMTGRNIKESLFDAPNTDKDSKPVFETKDLCLENEFENVSLHINSGEILGITGLLGSGRTELALSLYGMHPATSGEVFLDGKKIQVKSIDDAIKQGIVYLPEDRHTEGLCMRRAIYHNIHMSTFDKFVGKNGISESDMYDDALKWVDKFHIVTPNVENPVATLSGGNAQKVVISRLMSMNPKVLILNGPTVGVDVGAKFDIHEEIRRIAGEGVAVILISDDIAEVHANCNRIMVMRAGRITDEVRNCDVTEEELAEMLSRQE